MAQSKLNDFASKFGKAPNGLSPGLKFLAVAGAAAYGVSQAMYTGNFQLSINVRFYPSHVTEIYTFFFPHSRRWSQSHHILPRRRCSEGHHDRGTSLPRSVVPVPHHLRHPEQTEEDLVPHRIQGSPNGQYLVEGIVSTRCS